MAIKILVDSASDISKKEADSLGINMIPLTISFGNEDYIDGVDLLPNQFFEKLVESDVFPKTSQVNPYQFEEVYEKLTANGDQVLVITISSKLSGTYMSAVQAAQGYSNKVYVVDSLNACIGERLLCFYAMQLIEKNMNIEEIVLELNNSKSKIKLLALLNTLEYLKKGGRISPLVAFAGAKLSIKPVISVVDGEVKLVGKALGSKRGNNLLNTLVEKSNGIDFTKPLGTGWSGLGNELLVKYVNDSKNLWEGFIDDIKSYQVGSTIGTHVGPGAIVVAFFEK